MTVPAPDPVTAALLAAGPFVRDDAPFGLIRLGGPDATDFLQRLCSQDVQPLDPGQLAPAAFLDAKGKLIATSLVGRTADGFLLETPLAQRERVLQLLERFHFTEKLTFAAVPAVAKERVAAAAGEGCAGVAVTGDLVTIAFARRGIQFERWHAAATAGWPAAEGMLLDADRAACLRMAAGLVEVGAESEPTTLALEADLDDHCSATKGCYTGQEIVARIHTYGHTNRRLVLLHLAAGERIETPEKLLEPEDGIAVGRVMRAVPVPGQDLRVGVGYLPKDFQAPGSALRLEDGAAVTVVR